MSTATLPRRHRFTVDEYYRMAEAGVFKANPRVELIDGEIIDMAPMGTPHAAMTNQLQDVFQAAVHGLALVRVQLPLRLGPHSEPEPDLALVKPRADYYRGAHPTPDDAFLVVEVADSSLKDDLDVMAPLYARHGVPEVWVLDVQALELHVFRSPVAGRYTEAIVVKSPEVRELAALPVRVDLSGMWP